MFVKVQKVSSEFIKKLSYNMNLKFKTQIAFTNNCYFIPVKQKKENNFNNALSIFLKKNIWS